MLRRVTPTQVGAHVLQDRARSQSLLVEDVAHAQAM